MLKWNEEYYISFLGTMGQRFSTPVGKGFICKFDAEKEVERLRSRTLFKDFKIKVRTWD